MAGESPRGEVDMRAHGSDMWLATFIWFTATVLAMRVSDWVRANTAHNQEFLSWLAVATVLSIGAGWAWCVLRLK